MEKCKWYGSRMRLGSERKMGIEGITVLIPPTFLSPSLLQRPPDLPKLIQRDSATTTASIVLLCTRPHYIIGCCYSHTKPKTR